MTKLFNYLCMILVLVISSTGNSYCLNTCDINVGWKRDSLDWKTTNIHSSHRERGRAKSHIKFDDIESYAVTGNFLSVTDDYYFRGSASFSSSFKGHAHEKFSINSPLLAFPVDVTTRQPIKRGSETYDFNVAIGYPLYFCCSRLSVSPLIGFSFHRQQLYVKNKTHFGSSSDSSFSSLYFSSRSSDSDFFVQSSNPFSSSSSEAIDEALGLQTHKRTSKYRFTWYGFYLGADLAFALDDEWTLFSELEAHFLDRCHRKRTSKTGVPFVDHYHQEGWAYGFNGTFGLAYHLSACWYGTLCIDYKWWQADKKRDCLRWDTTAITAGLGYAF